MPMFDATMMHRMQQEVAVAQRVDLPGAVHLVLDATVAHFDPAAAMFSAMLEGWSRQQQSRFLRPATIRARLDLVRRFAAFTNQYPWEWTPGEVEAFTSDLVSGASPRAASTVRAYQLTVRLFCEFVTDARYGWPGECERRFGAVPSQICHEWNTITHQADYEGQPGRRALTFDEVQALFDAADARVDQFRSQEHRRTIIDP